MTEQNTNNSRHNGLSKVSTSIPGLDLILDGGIPDSRVTLLVGTAGSGKTVVGCDFLWRSMAEQKIPCVLVTFEESRERIHKNMQSFGWDLEEMEQSGMLAIVELTESTLAAQTVTGEYDLSIMIERIKHAVEKIGAKRVFIDSISAFIDQLGETPPVRRMLLQLGTRLSEVGVTTLLSGERYEEYGSLSAYKNETFVSDCVLVLRHILEEERVRRTIQVLKYRGSRHKQGEYPFTITDKGIEAMPLVGMELTAQSSNVRIKSGVTELDAMLGGGYFRDSIVLVSGPTGTGKTLLSSTFVNAACNEGERAILFAFEESREQLFRNGTSWGLELKGMEEKGLLRVVCDYPEVTGPEEHLLRMREEIEQFEPSRIAVDSLSAMERVVSVRSFREFVIALTSYIKQKQIAGFFTNTTATLLGGESITETHISTLTDSILLLRYVESQGEMRRGITVIKMRGSQHDKRIFEFEISDDGMKVREPFRNIESIMTGAPRAVMQTERDELLRLIKSDGGE